MSTLIAVTGKGGVGKTTVSALLINRLIAGNCQPVLAVDADPNSCLDVTLGVKAEKSIGTVREEAKQIAGKGMATGISKQQLLELKIAECLVEADNFDLIAMGRSEGPGCYCYANNVLKEVINSIASNYPYVVIDNEAGLENLSRRIVKNVDVLIMVTDSSKIGLKTIGRLHALTREMQIEYQQLVLIVNGLRDQKLPEGTAEIKDQTGAQFVTGLPFCEEIFSLSEQGKPLSSLNSNNPVIEAADSLLCSLELIKEKKTGVKV